MSTRSQRRIPHHERITGRPTKLTPETADAICQRLRAGVPRKQAAEGCGVDIKTLLDWILLGREAMACDLDRCSAPHHGPGGGVLAYSDFSDMVERAEADFVTIAVGEWRAGAKRDWRAARDLLLARHPEEFRARVEHKVEGPGEAGAPFEIVFVPSDRPQEGLDEFAKLGTAKSEPGSR